MFFYFHFYILVFLFWFFYFDFFILVFYFGFLFWFFITTGKNYTIQYPITTTRQMPKTNV